MHRDNTVDDLLHFFITFRFLMAMLGGVGAYLMQCGYLTVGSKLVQKPRFIQGLVYSFFSAVAGLCLINPPTPLNAFFVGLVGVVAMSNTFRTFRSSVSSSSPLESVSLTNSHSEQGSK